MYGCAGQLQPSTVKCYDPRVCPRDVSKKVLALCLFVLGCAEAQIERRDQAITFGTPSSIAAVLSLRVDFNCSRSADPSCSSVLIDPRHALTAAHCVLDFKRAGVITLFDPNAPTSEAPLEITRIVVHPNYDPVSREHDLAVLRLAQPTDKPPLETTELNGNEGEVTLVGGGTDGQSSPVLRREGKARIASIEANTLILHPDPSNACVGDSGGAVLSAESRQLIGLIRSGDTACDSFTKATLLGPYHDEFIEPTITELERKNEPLSPIAGDQCGPACASHDECPNGELCSGSFDTKGYCYYAPLLRPGVFTNRCEPSTESCGPNSDCLIAGSSCRCFEACDRAVDTSCHVQKKSGSKVPLLLPLIFLVAAYTQRRYLGRHATRFPTAAAGRTVATRNLVKGSINAVVALTPAGNDTNAARVTDHA